MLSAKTAEITACLKITRADFAGFLICDVIMLPHAVISLCPGVQ